MNDWHDEWWKQLEKTATDVEDFFAEIGEVTEVAVDEASENLSSFLEQFQLDVLEEVDNFIQNFVDVIITTSDEIDAAMSDEWENFNDDDFTRMGYHQPSAHSHPACIDCVNYHGQVYNGNLLVCAMHPSGLEGNNCPDWEQDPSTDS
ncbi:MAG: hypothetical protein AAGF83_25205 [Cyanobacteria bacterium P01_G01_bin.67]